MCGKRLGEGGGGVYARKLSRASASVARSSNHNSRREACCAYRNTKGRNVDPPQPPLEGLRTATGGSPDGHRNQLLCDACVNSHSKIA